MESSLAVLPGDRVGPAVGAQALKVLEAVGEKFGNSLEFNEGLADGVATDTLSRTLSYETSYTIVGYAKVEAKRRIIWSSI